MATKLFIVDDHYLVIEGIRSLLLNEKDIEWMGHAMNAASCLACLHNQLPDLILMDISLPDKNGVDLCKEIREKYPAVFIVGLSTFNQQSFVQKMMDNGASGYLLKNVTKQELLKAIKIAASGKIYLCEEAAHSLAKKNSNEIPVLTTREKEVLILIAEGLTNGEIATQLFISITTVDTHRKNLLAKFGAKNVASMVKAAAQFNFI